MPGPFQPEAWANGGGLTTELAREPEVDDWHWRASVAQIEQPGEFSTLPGVQRLLVPLDAPLTLHHDDQPSPVARLAVHRFDGAGRTRCELPQGPSRAFNLMLRHGHRAQLLARPLLGTQWLPPARWLVYLAAGRAQLSEADGDRLTLDTDQPVWVQPGAGRRVLIDGAGDLVLARLDPD
nr:HutD family protein [Oleiagrimonas sp. C23AA]